MGRSGTNCVFILGSVAMMLTGCASPTVSSSEWEKVGGTQEASSQNLDECVAQADQSVRTQAAIDADIAASRGTELRAFSSYQTNVQQDNDNTASRRDEMVGRCMILRGYIIGQ